MANKQKKKRNKQYTGADAALTKPVITRLSAANRSPLSQWWFEHKRVAKPILLIAAVALGLTWLIIEFIRIIN